MKYYKVDIDGTYSTIEEFSSESALAKSLTSRYGSKIETLSVGDVFTHKVSKTELAKIHRMARAIQTKNATKSAKERQKKQIERHAALARAQAMLSPEDFDLLNLQGIVEYFNGQ